MLGSIFLALEGGGEGFNPLDLHQGGNMLWTWIIFLVTLPFAWKVVLGPVTRALEERDDRAAKAIESAERASLEAERARAAVEVKIGEAQAGAARMLSEARERGEAREREILAEAKREADLMRDRAKTDIDAARDQALQAIRDEVIDLSLTAAGQVLGRTVDSADDRRLASDVVSASASSRGAGGGA